MSRISSGRDIYSSQMEKTTDITSHKCLVEVELRRRALYADLLESVKRWLFERSSRIRLSKRQLSHILLHYIFNKKATTSTSQADPVFITGTSKLARCQLQRYLENAHLKVDEELADLIDEKLESATEKMHSTKFRMDNQAELSFHFL